jgi:serine/threonine-protein kinase
MILPNLQTFLKGDYQPRDNDERIALLGVCQFKGLYRTAARLCAGALSADPRLADDLPGGHRYRAACFAVLAAGQGKEAEKIEDKERVRLRRYALDWLRADLMAWAKTTDSVLVQKKLRQWQYDASLAGVRDEKALAKLPEVERQGWRQLWSDVADLLQKTGGQK